MLKPRLVIPLQIYLSKLLGNVEGQPVLYQSPVPKTQAGTSNSPRAEASKRKASTCWLGGDRTASLGSMQAIARAVVTTTSKKGNPSPAPLRWMERSGQKLCVGSDVKHVQDCYRLCQALPQTLLHPPRLGVALLHCGQLCRGL